MKDNQIGAYFLAGLFIAFLFRIRQAIHVAGAIGGEEGRGVDEEKGEWFCEGLVVVVEEAPWAHTKWKECPKLADPIRSIVGLFSFNTESQREVKNKMSSITIALHL